MAVIDKDGNIFDVTPSGGWVPGAVILGDTGIGMSVRGEQFWLDKTHANQIRPRARPRYTLTPSLVFKGDMPMMGLGTPGGDNQDQTILQAFLSIVDFWDEWYPNLHAALERPRAQTMHFYGSFWPHTAGFNQLNVEATIPDAVYNELKARGHDVSRLRPFGMSGCATAVMIDPATRNRFAAADPRRDCYAIAYRRGLHLRAYGASADRSGRVGLRASRRLRAGRVAPSWGLVGLAAFRLRQGYGGQVAARREGTDAFYNTDADRGARAHGIAGAIKRFAIQRWRCSRARETRPRRRSGRRTRRIPTASCSQPPRQLAMSGRAGAAGGSVAGKPEIKCGMTMIPADPNIDPQIAISRLPDGTRFTIRAIEPPICR